MLLFLLASLLQITLSKVVPDTVQELDVNQYLGHWSQVYGAPTNVIFQGYGECITADYGLLDNGYVSVLNTQTNEYAEIETISGYAYYKNISEPGKLTVHLEGVPTDAPYWVVKLGEVIDNEYQYSIITTPSGVSLWVLVRDIDTFYELYDDEVTDFLQEYNFMYTTIKQDNCEANKYTTFYTKNVDSQQRLWKEFKQKYNKNYDAQEDSKRFLIFVENLLLIDERNALDTNRVHGITMFTDMSQDEFETKYNQAIKPSLRSNTKNINNDIKSSGSSFIDWTGVYTTPVKDQGYCGSCWAFSATEQVESDAMRVFGVTYILSPEQTTQCTRGAFGCGGGWTETAYAYIKGVQGLVQDIDYPYTSYMGRTGTCNTDLTKAVMGLTSFTTIGGTTSTEIETNMANYMLSTGPLSVCLDASSWNSYVGGIMTVCGKNVDHCVQAVGVDTSATNGYWKVRNSWGTSWGENGFIRLSYGENTCDITNDPTYVTPKYAY
jgi:lipocalin/C1A family cysteine protease